jgi:predicted TIM-barrel fold metal-dependent hydrolase
MDRLAVSVRGGNRGIDVPGLPMYPADYFRRQCYISADPDDPGIKPVIDSLGDDNIVVATDFGHPEGHRYSRSIDDLLELPGVSADSKRKIMWDNARKLYQL